MLLMALALAVQALPPLPMTVETHQDAITDRVSAFATLRDGDNRLVVGCDRAGGDIKVTVHTGRWLVRGALFHGHRNFTYRFDRERPRRLLWVPNDRSASLVMNRRVVPFLQALANSSRVVIRMRDVEKNWFDTPFRLAGTRPALNRLFDSCRRPDLAERVLSQV